MGGGQGLSGARSSQHEVMELRDVICTTQQRLLCTLVRPSVMDLQHDNDNNK